jgi:hypothetical protein
MLHRQSLAAAILLLLASLFHHVGAQEGFLRQTQGMPSSHPAELSGLITTRLTPKSLARWKAIERLVFAEDVNRQPLHPTLRSLWEWVETSGHAVLIEIVHSTRNSTCTAGSFIIEHFDPKGERHVAVIRLNLSNIDQAYVGPEAARAGGFIPFDGLSREERYAEVLGHELSHAIHILTSLERTKKVEEMVEKTNELLLSQPPRRKDGLLSVEMKRRLFQRDALLQELEKQAEAMEYIVWRELTAGKSVREKPLYHPVARR